MRLVDAPGSAVRLVRRSCHGDLAMFGQGLESRTGSYRTTRRREGMRVGVAFPAHRRYSRSRSVEQEPAVLRSPTGEQREAAVSPAVTESVHLGRSGAVLVLFLTQSFPNPRSPAISSPAGLELRLRAEPLHGHQHLDLPRWRQNPRMRRASALVFQTARRDRVCVYLPAEPSRRERPSHVPHTGSFKDSLIAEGGYIAWLLGGRCSLRGWS